jgi:hypothetical protein
MKKQERMARRLELAGIICRIFWKSAALYEVSKRMLSGEPYELALQVEGVDEKADKVYFMLCKNDEGFWRGTVVEDPFRDDERAFYGLNEFIGDFQNRESLRGTSESRLWFVIHNPFGKGEPSVEEIQVQEKIKLRLILDADLD